VTTRTLDDRVLIRDFRQSRREEPFRALYRRHTPSIYAMAVRMCADEADEIVQEAWVRAVEAIHRFRGDSSFRTWLTSITINCARETIRRRRRIHEAMSDQAMDRRPTDSAGEGIDIERAIAALPDGYREVLVLYDVHGYSHREIGELLGIAEGTCKSQLSRARRAVRLALGDAFGSADGRRGQHR
jgi:RNA polymerase sigma-70 factor, ECF subfamily